VRDSPEPGEATKWYTTVLTAERVPHSPNARPLRLVYHGKLGQPDGGRRSAESRTASSIDPPPPRPQDPASRPDRVLVAQHAAGSGPTAATVSGPVATAASGRARPRETSAPAPRRHGGSSPRRVPRDGSAQSARAPPICSGVAHRRPRSSIWNAALIRNPRRRYVRTRQAFSTLVRHVVNPASLGPLRRPHRPTSNYPPPLHRRFSASLRLAERGEDTVYLSSGR